MSSSSITYSFLIPREVLSISLGGSWVVQRHRQGHGTMAEMLEFADENKQSGITAKCGDVTLPSKADAQLEMDELRHSLDDRERVGCCGIIPRKTRGFALSSLSWRCC